MRSLLAILAGLLIVAGIFRARQSKKYVSQLVESNCKKCGHCIKSCDRGALHFTVDAAQKRSLALEPERCTACGSCVAVRKSGALTLSKRT